MDSPPARFQIEELLTHSDWLRRLAGELVRSSDSPDDVLQDTWLAALRSPPLRDRAAEPWLVEVVKNFAFRAYRSRRARETREARGELVPAGPVPPDVLVERAEAQRLMVEAVLRLAEPFRSTV